MDMSSDWSLLATASAVCGAEEEGEALLPPPRPEGDATEREALDIAEVFLSCLWVLPVLFLFRELQREHGDKGVGVKKER
jgi:hypothetical protein